MKTNNQNTSSLLDRTREQLKALIKMQGWGILGVMSSESFPTYSYTVGLMEYGCPELIVIGLEPTTARHTLNIVAQKLVDEGSLPVNKPLEDLFWDYPPVLRELPEQVGRSHLRAASEFAKEHTSDFQAYQVVWPDSAGRYPWDAENTATWDKLQPLLKEVRA